MLNNVRINIEIIIASLGKSNTANNISYPQMRQQWFSVCIIPLSPEYSGLTGNRQLPIAIEDSLCV